MELLARGGCGRNQVLPWQELADRSLLCWRGVALNLDLDNKGTMHSVSLLTIGRGGRAKSIEEDVNSNTPYVGEASPV